MCRDVGRIRMMNTVLRLTLTLCPDILAVCRLDPDGVVPPWASGGPLTSITRTPAELSVVCLQKGVPEGVRCERGWRCLAVQGPLAFGLTGVLASLTRALAPAGVSVFAISTFDTDYLLVREADVERTVELLSREGHRVLKYGANR
jgi:hypothetical protein